MLEIIASMQLLGGIVCVGGYPLQFWRLWKLKRSDEFSLFWTATVAIGLLFMEPYALYLVIHDGTGHFWLVTHTASVIATSTLALMVWRYR